ncbi:MAG: cell division protein FtsA [Planctomycetota bacterium]
MPVPPMTIELTTFEQLEIVRTEVEARDEELRQVESKIRTALFEAERLKYLQVLHPSYLELPQPPDVANVPQLEARREVLRQTLVTLRAALSALEKETAGQVAPAPRGKTRVVTGAGAATPGQRRKFDSFDDFRANR